MDESSDRVASNVVSVALGIMSEQLLDKGAHEITVVFVAETEALALIFVAVLLVSFH